MADSASLPDRSKHWLCCYINITPQIQLARLVHSSNGGFEQVVFPGQRWLFEALPEAWLEISSATHPSPEQISCVHLKVTEGNRDIPWPQLFLNL
jgi:Domain of unknown function (DUF1830)